MRRLSRHESQAQTRQRLRQAGRREFARRGIGAASVDRISASAGFSRGAFYANYASKHDLLLELLSQHQAAEIAAWQDVLDRAGSLECALPILRDRFDAYAGQPEDVLFAVELQVEALRNPEFAARYRDCAREIAARTRKLAEAFLAHGGANRVSAAVLADALQSFSLHVIVQARMGLGEADVTPGERLVAMIGDLLASPPHGDPDQP